MRGRALWVVVSLVLSMATSAAAQTIDLPSIRGSVVRDADGTPVAGARIIVIWHARTGTPFDPRSVVLAEAVTAADGTFSLPGGPTTELSHAPDPADVGAYAAGYKIASVKGAASARTIEMRLIKFDGKPAARAEELSQWAMSLGMWAVMTASPSQPQLIA